MAKALMVDDEDISISMLATALRHRGHELIGATNGRKGLDTLSQVDDVDIIFLDYNMPIMSGYEFSKAVRTDPQYTSCSDIPIIGIGSFPEDKKEYLTDTLTKPFHPDEMVECIDAHCS